MLGLGFSSGDYLHQLRLIRRVFLLKVLSHLTQPHITSYPKDLLSSLLLHVKYSQLLREYPDKLGCACICNYFAGIPKKFQSPHIRHKREKKKLDAQVKALKLSLPGTKSKTAKKRNRAARKVVLAKIAAMKKDYKERTERELQQYYDLEKKAHRLLRDNGQDTRLTLPYAPEVLAPGQPKERPNRPNRHSKSIKRLKPRSKSKKGKIKLDADGDNEMT